MGRKKIKIDWGKLDAILQFHPTLNMCAGVLEISHDTLQKRIEEEKKCTFGEYREAKTSSIKIKLQQKAITKALSGDNTMLIFCLKNLCGWADKQEVTTHQTVSIDFKKIKDMSQDELQDAIDSELS